MLSKSYCTRDQLLYRLVIIFLLFLLQHFGSKSARKRRLYRKYANKQCMRKFFVRNPWKMHDFYTSHSGHEKLPPVVAEIRKPYILGQNLSFPILIMLAFKMHSINYF